MAATRLLPVLALALIPATGFLGDRAFAGDLMAGKAKAEATCQVCHGLDGIGTMPMFPNLAGQKALYLEQQLKAFRDGSRQSEVMAIVIRDLSDQDIENLAAYYESLPHAGAGE